MGINKRKYYEWHSDEPGYRDYLDFFQDKHAVLDLGCGSGWLGKHHKNLYGLDNDLAAVKQASKHERAFVCDISKKEFPFKKNFFDGVIAKDIIEHVSNPIEFMNKISRVLKKKGLLYIATKLPSNSFWNDYTHVRPYNKRSLISLLNDNDYQVIKIWCSGNWPGLGILMRLFKINKTPRIFFFLTRIGINRNSINIMAVRN